MRVAIVGGPGLLGQRIIADRYNPGIQWHAFDHDEIEVTDEDSVKRALDGYDLAINAAAMHQLAACEADPERARLVNYLGALFVARTVPTVFVSSDYVFSDGGPHDESLPGKSPRSSYGQSKLLGELATLEHSGVVVRVAGLFDHHFRSHKGPSFPETILSSHDPIRLPTDQVFSPTYAPDAAERIVDLALGLTGDYDFPAMSPYTCPIGIYHAANDGATSWAAFGQEIADLARHDRHISGYEAKDPIRPRNSSLVSTRLPPLRHYKQALQAWSEKR